MNETAPASLVPGQEEEEDELEEEEEGGLGEEEADALGEEVVVLLWEADEWEVVAVVWWCEQEAVPG